MKRRVCWTFGFAMIAAAAAWGQTDRIGAAGHEDPAAVGAGAVGAVDAAPAEAARPRFVAQGPVVVDRLTGLIWQRDGEASGRLNFEGAEKYAAKLRIGRYHGWRVPTREELLTIFPAGEPFVRSGYQRNRFEEGADPNAWREYWTCERDLSYGDGAYLYEWSADGAVNNGLGSTNFVHVRAVHDPLNGPAAAAGEPRAINVAEVNPLLSVVAYEVDRVIFLKLIPLGEQPLAKGLKAESPLFRVGKYAGPTVTRIDAEMVASGSETVLVRLWDEEELVAQYVLNPATPTRGWSIGTVGPELLMQRASDREPVPVMVRKRAKGLSEQ